MQWGRTIGQMPSPYTAGNPLIAPYHFGGTEMLRLPRPVWIQLAILGIITVVSVGIMAFGFIDVPALLGIGRYTVTVDLPASGRLYPTSVVSYRGTEVGRVESIDVTRDGVRAVLKLESGTPIPTPVQASVHSRSAVGEQFLELTPKAAGGRNSGTATSSRPPRCRPHPTSEGFSTPPTRRCRRSRRTTCARSSTRRPRRSAGWAPNWPRIVDGSTALAIEAGKTVGPLTELIDQSPPVLDSQVRTSDSIAAWAAHMAAITGQFEAQDAAVADLLRVGGPALDEGRALFDRFAPTLPVLLANLVSLGDIAVTYRSDLEQLLVLFPRAPP